MSVPRPGPSPTTALRAAGSTRRVDRRAAVLWCLAVPGTALAVATAVAVAWRPELPDRVAAHWGPDGVDGFASVATLLVGAGATTVALAVALWLVNRLAGRQAAVRRFANGLATWTGVLVPGVVVGSLAGQRGLADASQAPPGDVASAATLVGASVLGVLAATLTPGDPAQPADRPVPADAPRLPLAEGEHATWVRRVAPSRGAWVVVAVAAFSALIGAITQMWAFALALLVSLGIVLALALYWTVTVDATGLTARPLIRRPALHVPLDEVEVAEVGRADPLGEFGGWGLRTGLDGRTGVVLRRGEALQVRRTGGRVVVVTVDDAATAAALLNTLAARVRG